MNNKNIEEKCCAGCKIYTGGEVRHLPECVFYPESLSRIYDEKDILLTQYKEALRELVDNIEKLNLKLFGTDYTIYVNKIKEALPKAKQLLNNE